MCISFDNTLDIASILTLIIIIVIVFYNHKQYTQMGEQLKIQNKQLETQNEQTKHNFFADYTKRYQEIILHFPENINEDNFSYNDLDEKIQDLTMRYMRVYFDLCYEEYFLHKKNYIDEDVWKDWKEGMESAFSKPAFKQAWNRVVKDSFFYKDFKKFVEEKLLKK